MDHFCRLSLLSCFEILAISGAFSQAGLQYELGEAAANGNAGLIRLLLKLGPVDVNWRDENAYDDCEEWKGAIRNGTFLHRAAASCNLTGAVEVIRLLLDHGADVNAEEQEYGNLPIAYAARRGNTAAVQLLLERGSRANSTNREGDGAITYAAMTGSLETVRLLLDRGAFSGDIDTAYETLMRAIEDSHLEIVRLLLDRGVKLNHRNGTSPLFWPAFDGDLEMVDLLVKHGADINSADEDGSTVLNHAALVPSAIDVYCYLARRGASRDGCHGELCTIARCPRVMKFQIDWASTPLMVKAEAGDLDGVRRLLDIGASLHIRNQDGEIALHFAAFQGHLEIARLLLDRGAEINLENRQAQTPLMLAASQGHLETVRLLLDRGANVDTKNMAGGTALSLAATSGKRDVVRLLLSRGASKAGCFAQLCNTR